MDFLGYVLLSTKSVHPRIDGLYRAPPPKHHPHIYYARFAGKLRPCDGVSFFFHSSRRCCIRCRYAAWKLIPFTIGIHHHRHPPTQTTHTPHFLPAFCAKHLSGNWHAFADMCWQITTAIICCCHLLSSFPFKSVGVCGSEGWRLLLRREHAAKPNFHYLEFKVLLSRAERIRPWNFICILCLGSKLI